MRRHGLACCLAVLSSACGLHAASPPQVAPAAPTRIEAQARIVTPNEVTTEVELAHRAERALIEQRWQEAADAYATLFAADPTGPNAAEYAFSEGLALEGLGDRPRARDAYLDLSRRFPEGAKARAALVRAAT